MRLLRGKTALFRFAKAGSFVVIQSSLLFRVGRLRALVYYRMQGRDEEDPFEAVHPVVDKSPLRMI